MAVGEGYIISNMTIERCLFAVGFFFVVAFFLMASVIPTSLHHSWLCTRDKWLHTVLKYSVSLFRILQNRLSTTDPSQLIKRAPKKARTQWKRTSSLSACSPWYASVRGVGTAKSMQHGERLFCLHFQARAWFLCPVIRVSV